MKKLKLSEKKLLLLINLTERRYLGTAAAASTGSTATGQPQKPNLTKLNQVSNFLKLYFFSDFNNNCFLIYFLG